MAQGMNTYSIESGVVTIPFRNGMRVLIDESVCGFISRWDWGISPMSGLWYAVRSEGPRSAYRKILMHRSIMGDPDAFVDHINHDTLDNRRSNLRACTCAQNAYNKKLSSANRSGFKGVCWDRERSMWVAHIKLNGSNRKLGRFKQAVDAAAAYDTAAHNLFGEFALTNRGLGLL